LKPSAITHILEDVKQASQGNPINPFLLGNYFSSIAKWIL